MVSNGIVPQKIALIICSQRPSRAGVTISKWVLDTIEPINTPATPLEPLDLQDWNLPFLNEPYPSKAVPAKASYVHKHTRRWSAAISSYAGFIFLTPQYNGGYPATVKNAIDYLYHEWTRKPAMVVSYGHHGGGKAGRQLGEVLAHMRMQVVSVVPQLTLTGDLLVPDKVLSEEQMELWEVEQAEVLREGWRELVRLMTPNL